SSPSHKHCNADKSERKELQCKTDKSNQLIRLKLVQMNALESSRNRENSPPVPKRPKSSDECCATTRFFDVFTNDSLIENRGDKFEAYPLGEPRKSIESLFDGVVKNDERSDYFGDSSPKV
uniref:Uncharacterized protein n=1 Tax=Romanomermis culicivorax TaxID=13658 RepID=A0A915JA77_ROMCU